MSEPPFLGTEILERMSIGDIWPLIDLDALFIGRWQFRRGADEGGWKAIREKKAIPLYERLKSQCESNETLVSKAVYGFFKCSQSGSAIVVNDEKGDAFRFEFPRERKEPHRCVADFFPDGFAAFQVVTVGNAVNDLAKDMFGRSAYSDAFYLKGLAAEACEATAAFVHDHIRKQLGASKNQGVRFSPGYPVFPDLLYQRKIMALLKPGRIGVSLTKTCMLVPEHSTSALVSVDEKACLFNPNV